MNIQFKKNIERDIKIWQNSIVAKSYGVDWKKFLPSDITVESVKNKKILKIYLEKNYYQSGKVSEFITWLKENVKIDEVTEDIETLMGKKFINDVTAFITTFHRGPYNVSENIFYLILRNSNRKRAITNIYHELMHFLFHIYFWKTCQGTDLSDVQIHTLKESLTVLLNPILEKRKLPFDNGYQMHQELRAQLKNLWVEDKNFESFLNKVLRLRIVN